LEHFTFAPGTVTVGRGSTLQWVNRDDIPHTVVSQDRTTFKSKRDTDDKFSYTFQKPRSYTYFYSIPHKKSQESLCNEPRRSCHGSDSSANDLVIVLVDDECHYGKILTIPMHFQFHGKLVCVLCPVFQGANFVQ
jgi:hypothetical protein